MNIVHFLCVMELLLKYSDSKISVGEVLSSVGFYVVRRGGTSKRRDPGQRVPGGVPPV